jgi:hypothetical protein
MGNLPITVMRGEERNTIFCKKNQNHLKDSSFHDNFHLKKNPKHSLSVLRFHDGLHGGAQHLDTELVQHTVPVQVNGAVECGLAAEGTEQASGAFLFDNLNKNFVNST